MGKVDSTQEQMDNLSKTEVRRKDHKEMLEIKNTVIEMKNALMGLLIDWTRIRKESLSWRMFQ